MKLMIKAAAIGLAIVALGACKKTDVNENVVANSTDNTVAPVDVNAMSTNTTTTTNTTDTNAAAPAATTNTTTTTTNSSGNAM